MRNYSKVLKIAPAFLLAGTIMLEAQQRDSIKQRDIEQVVLIGYGAKKKSDLTGSITALSEKDFNNEFTMNFWDNYDGFDRNRDGYGDNTYRLYQYADKLWTYNPSVKFFYGSPVLSLLNFLSKLAPFSEPIFLLEDKQPKFIN